MLEDRQKVALVVEFVALVVTAAAGVVEVAAHGLKDDPHHPRPPNVHYLLLNHARGAMEDLVPKTVGSTTTIVQGSKPYLLAAKCGPAMIQVTIVTEIQVKESDS